MVRARSASTSRCAALTTSTTPVPVADEDGAGIAAVIAVAHAQQRRRLPGAGWTPTAPRIRRAPRKSSRRRPPATWCRPRRCRVKLLATSRNSRAAVMRRAPRRRGAGCRRRRGRRAPDRSGRSRPPGPPGINGDAMRQEPRHGDVVGDDDDASPSSPDSRGSGRGGAPAPTRRGPEVGSSIKTRRGAVTRLRAICNRWRIPPEKRVGGSSIRSAAISTRSSQSRARARIVRNGARRAPSAARRHCRRPRPPCASLEPHPAARSPNRCGRAPGVRRGRFRGAPAPGPPGRGSGSRPYPGPAPPRASTAGSTCRARFRPRSQHLALGDVEIDAGAGGAGAVGLGEPVGGEQRGHRAPSRRDSQASVSEQRNIRRLGRRSPPRRGSGPRAAQSAQGSVKALHPERMVLEIEAADLRIGRHGVDPPLAARSEELERRAIVHLRVVELGVGTGPSRSGRRPPPDRA